MAPSMAGAFLGGTLGALAGPYGVVLGGIVGAFIPSLVLGLGETQQAVKQKGGEGAEAPGHVLAAGTAIAVLDSALPFKMGSKLVKSFGKVDLADKAIKLMATKTLRQTAAAGLKEGGKGLTIEGVAEAIQEAISETAAASGTGTEVDAHELARDMVQAFAVGAFLGAGASSVTSVGSDLNQTRRVKNALDKLHQLKQESKLPHDMASEVAGENMAAAGVDQVLVPVDVVLRYVNEHPTLVPGEALDRSWSGENLEQAILGFDTWRR